MLAVRKWGLTMPLSQTPICAVGPCMVVLTAVAQSRMPPPPLRRVLMSLRAVRPRMKEVYLHGQSVLRSAGSPSAAIFIST